MKTLTSACVSIFIGLLLSSSAYAQATTVSAGYSFLHELGTPGVTYGVGYSASVAWTPGGTWGIVGDIGGNFRNPANVSQQLFGALGGVRLTGTTGPIKPFAQGLIGLERYSEPGFSENGLAIQPGVGLDWFFLPSWALRAQGDYRWVRANGDTFHELRVVAGVTFAF
jgi:hypothetical protein